ncbi:DUF2637 domain-containing protein [Kitasatospora sp. NPDC052896]|uniref:DUF2637 domain-containing protein n=1 Tax=Kitasatospora sp. NPDC052896 TaxID=3364061 RepID=UPI0037C7A6F1
MARPSLTRAHRALLSLVAVGACLISGIGFAGSYSAVRALAVHKGFGTFAYAFPIGVDAGIVVLLALDLVLTWLRIPFPLLRQAAWLLTVATIAFNAAASWGDPLGMGMHAVIPVLFVVIVEASRHAVGRIAAITADRHMESVRLMRWVLSPVPTFRLWRRMQLWELRSYDEVVRLEQNRLVYRAQLRFRYGRGWRRSAPIQALLPLKLAKYGVPLDVTSLDRLDGGLPRELGGQGTTVTSAVAPAQSSVAVPPVSAAVAVPPVSAAVAVPTLAKLAAARWRDAQGASESSSQAAQAARAAQGAQAVQGIQGARLARDHQVPAITGAPAAEDAPGGQRPNPAEPPADGVDVAKPVVQQSPWFRPQPAQPQQSQQPNQSQQSQQPQAGEPRPTPARPEQQQPVRQQPDPRVAEVLQAVRAQAAQVAGSAGAERPVAEPARDAETGPLNGQWGAGQLTGQQAQQAAASVFTPRVPVPAQAGQEQPAAEPAGDVPEETPRSEAKAAGTAGPQLTVDLGVEALIAYQESHGQDPDEERLAQFLFSQYGVSGRQPGSPVSVADMRRMWPALQDRYASLGRE